MSKKLSLIKNYITNRMKLCEFALNNICTAKCKFCSIWQQKEKHIVDTSKALQAVSHLGDLGINFITLTGGEPLLHPDFDKIIERCTEKNILTAILVADARLLNEERLEKLKRANVDLVCISIDHHTNAVASESRGIKDILLHIEKAVASLKKLKISTLASTLICKYNYNTLDELFGKCEEVGFDVITVNYPEFSESPVYTLGGCAIDISREDFITALETVKSLKKKYRNLLNSPVSVDNIISYLKGEKVKYMCLGGYKTFFIDWNFNCYPCMHHGGKMGDVLELTEASFVKRPCNDCNMSWYRDFSIYFQGAKSIKPLLSTVPVLFNQSLFNNP